MTTSLLARVTAFAGRLRADGAATVLSAGQAIAAWLMDRGWIEDDRRKRMTALSGVAHRVVWCVVEDALAEGWSTDEPGKGGDVTELLDRALRLGPALLSAGGASREGGIGYLWLVTLTTKDDRTAWVNPWVQGQETVTAIHAVSYDEATPLEWERNPESRDFGKPSIYQLNCRREGMVFAAVRVHASRLVRIEGAQSTPSQDGPMPGRGLPVLDLYRMAIENLELGWSGMGRLLDRLSMPHMTLPPGAESIAGGSDNDKLDASLELVANSMQSDKMLITFNGGSFDWKGPSLGGASEAFSVLYEAMSAVEGIPVTRFAGQAPGGLSTDDQSGRRNYDSVLSHWRTERAEPALLQVYDRILGPNPERRIRWPALSKPTAVEEAQINASDAAAESARVTAGILDADEIREDLGKGERYPGLTARGVADPMDELLNPGAPPPEVP